MDVGMETVCLIFVALAFWAGRRNGRKSLLDELGTQSGRYSLGELQREVHMTEWRWLKKRPYE